MKEQMLQIGIFLFQGLLLYIQNNKTECVNENSNFSEALFLKYIII